MRVSTSNRHLNHGMHEFLQGVSLTRLWKKIERFPSEDHGSITLQSMYNGLRFVIDGYYGSGLWRNPPLSIVSAYQKLSDRLGYEIIPHHHTVTGASMAAFGPQTANLAEGAIECLKLNVTNCPGRASSYSNLAMLYAANGQEELAIRNYEQALKLDPSLKVTKDALEILKTEAKTAETK